MRSRAKALDRLVEFVELFPDVKELCVIYSTTPDDVELILKRIEPLVPRERILISRIGPVVGTHTGPGVLGIVVSQGIEA